MNKNLLSSITKWCAEKSYKLADKPGHMLTVVGSLGWAISSAAQLVGIWFNEKIPKEQKKFLLYQEGADACVNISAFFVLTKSFTKMGEKLVKSGKIATAELRKHYKDIKIDGKAIEDSFGKKMNVIEDGKKKLDINGNPLQKDFDISDLNIIKEPSKDKLVEKFKKDYFAFEDGISFIFNVVGSIISCNILTPIVRNKIASHFQKISIAQDKLQNETTNQTFPAQSRIGMDDYRKQIGAKSLYPSSGMRV